VLGVVGVDTFHRLDYTVTPEEARQRAETFCTDLPAGVHAMVRELFHPDADPVVMADAERRMQNSPPDAAYAMFMSLAGYDQAAPARELAAPLRAINGDLWPTDVAAVRKIKPDFQAVVMKHTGHYPMLDCDGAWHHPLMKWVLRVGSTRNTTSGNEFTGRRTGSTKIVTEPDTIAF
jgi:hypothetical protein